MLALLAGLWAALIRAGWQLPAWQPRLPSLHGALMISGFLGTLISLERAVALAVPLGTGAARRWTYAAPAISALGGLALILGLPIEVGRGLILLGSAGLVMIFVVIVRLRRAWDTATMALGAWLWLAGNVVWWADGSTYRAAFWWIAFLVLTIAGERLELARVLLLRRSALVTFLASVGLSTGGLVVSLVDFTAGVRLSGAGLIALGLWLLTRDIARRTIRQAGVTRFIAACLLPGYAWLTFAGGLWLFGKLSSGMSYDAALHSVLLGFVFSMIFGHAPIILPAVLNTPVIFRPIFYAHLILLHASLALRIAGDAAFDPAIRTWAGLLNVIAVLLFMGATIWALRSSLRSRDSAPAVIA
jgi:hypothetical protein